MRPQPHELFDLLSEPTRLRLMSIFLQTNHELCVCELVDALRIPHYRASKHLSLLKTVGLLRARRDGTWVHYRLASDVPPMLRDLLKVLRRHLGENFQADWHQLRKRLQLRKEGRCIVGVNSGHRPRRLSKTKTACRTSNSSGTKRSALVGER